MLINKKNSTADISVSISNIIELAHNFLKKDIKEAGIGEIICLLKSEYILDISQHRYIYKAPEDKITELGDGNDSIITNPAAESSSVNIPISHAIAIHSTHIIVYSGRYFMKIKKYIENSLANIIATKTKTEVYEQQELERCMEMIKGILLIIKKMLCGVEFLYSIPLRDQDGSIKYLPGDIFAISAEPYKPMLADVINMYQQFSQQDQAKADDMLNNFFALFTMNYRIVLQYLKAIRGFIDQLTDICPLERRSMVVEIYSFDDGMPYELHDVLRTISPNDNITTHAKVIKEHISDGITIQKTYSLEQIIDKLVKVLSSPIDDVSTLYHLMLSVADLAAVVPQMASKIKTGVDTNNQRLIKIQEAITSMYNSRKMGVGQFMKFSGQLVNNVIDLLGLQNVGKIDIEKIMSDRKIDIINNSQAKKVTKIKDDQIQQVQINNDEQAKKKFSTIVDNQNRKDDTVRVIAGFK